MKRSARRGLPFATMLVSVLAVLGTPMLRTPRFYWWDDSLASFTGMWDRLASAVLEGRLPWLELDLWRGGNLVSEAGLAMFNPLVVLLAVVVHPLDDLALRMTVFKVVLALLMASGVYLLARDYGSRRWPAAAAGVAVCATGYTMYFDFQTWVNGLLIGALIPWYWLALRRLSRSPFMVLAAAGLGYLLVTTGNPYGIIALGAVVIAVGVEHAVQGHRTWFLGLLAQSVIAASAAALVYLPLLITSAVGYRQGSYTFNDEFLSPNLSNLLGASTPLYMPYVRIFSGPIVREPIMYIAWYLLPMLPWVRWTVLRERWRGLCGLVVFGTGFLVFLLGPGQIWMFRWPARLLPMIALPLLIGAALAFSAGLHRVSRGRVAASLVIVLLGWWMALSDDPQAYLRFSVATAIIAVFVVVLVRLAAPGLQQFLAIVLGTLAVLGMNSVFYPYNRDIANYAVPSSASALRDGLGADAKGLTVVIAPGPDAESGVQPSSHLLIGSLYGVAGVNSPSSYSGIGYTAADRALCVNYNGSTCPELWDSLWAVPDGEKDTLADVLGVQTVVVQKGYVPSPQTPSGWTLATEDDRVLLYTRTAELPHPTGTVTVVSPGVQVSEDRRDGPTGEVMKVSTGSGDGSTVTFSRLAWPGYAVTLDGSPLPLVSAPAGLLRAELPAATSGTLRVEFVPPGVRVGLAGVGLGLLLTVLELLRQQRLHRRRGDAEQSTSPAPPTARGRRLPASPEGRG